MRHHFTTVGVLGLAMIAAAAVTSAASPAAAGAGTPGPGQSVTRDVTLLATTDFFPAPAEDPSASAPDGEDSPLFPESGTEIASSNILQGCQYPHIPFADYDQLCIGYSPASEGMSDVRNDFRARNLAEYFLETWEVRYNVTCTIDYLESSNVPAEGGSQYNLNSICHNQGNDSPVPEPQPQPGTDLCPTPKAVGEISECLEGPF